MTGRILRPWTKWMAVAGVLGAVLLTFLCLRPSPHVRDFAWLPGWFVQWVDTHGVSRNSVAFGALAALAGGAVPARGRMQVHLIVAGFAAALEFTQLLIPSRAFDLRDIAASWLGVGIAWGVGSIIRALRWRLAGMSREE